MTKPSPSLLERLMLRSIQQGGCLVWTAATNANGYGVISIGGRAHLVHRVAWVERHGPIADGICVLHHCDNPPCFSDSCLFLGTRTDNNADKVAKGRARGGRWHAELTHCPAGHGYTEENTYRDAKGWRKCKTCVLAQQRRYRLRRLRERTAS